MNFHKCFHETLAQKLPRIINDTYLHKPCNYVSFLKLSYYLFGIQITLNCERKRKKKKKKTGLIHATCSGGPLSKCSTGEVQRVEVKIVWKKNSIQSWDLNLNPQLGKMELIEFELGLSWGWVGVWVEGRIGQLWNTLLVGIHLVENRVWNLQTNHTIRSTRYKYLSKKRIYNLLGLVIRTIQCCHKLCTTFINIKSNHITLIQILELKNANNRYANKVWLGKKRIKKDKD